MTSPPDLPLSSERRSLWQRVSIVWLIPIAALAITLGIAWQAYSDRGPIIRIDFDTASSVKAGETEVRFRDVAVGVVEDVGFAPDLDKVRVRVRLDKEIAAFVDADARFWVVEPEVTTRGVSGLDTVLSGVFIEGVWDQDPGGLQRNHEGLADPPLLRAGEKGLRILLRATPGTVLTEGTPILYKGIEVGQVGTPELAGNGSAATAEAVIREPYDRLVTTSTRFWDTSGFSFSLGANGAELNFSSLAALISGAVTFETVVSGGSPPADGAQFDLFVDESTARSSLFTDGDGPLLNLTVIFDDNVSGLTSGAAVELSGVVIGEVANLTGVVDRETFGDSRVRLLATLALRPARLGLPDDGADAALRFLADQVDAGLRARLTTASLLTGGLKVELVQVQDPPVEPMDLAAEPFPLLPSTASEISDVSASAEGVLQRINDLPIEGLIASAIRFLDSATAVTSSEALRSVPEDVSALIGDIRGVVSSEEIQSLPVQISILVDELQAATGDLRGILLTLDDADAAERLLSAVDAAAGAANSVRSSVEGLPQLVDRLTVLADNAASVPLDTLAAEVEALLSSADAFLSEEETRTLPSSLNAALAEVRGALEDLRAGGAVETLNDTVASAGRAAEAIEAAALRLPELAERIDRLVARADAAVSSFDPNSGLTQDARRALRELEAAADAIEDLARTLERRPNSIILGR